MRSAGLEVAQAGIKIARRNTNNLKYADNTNLMAESEEELKSLLMKVKEESKKVGLKAQHSEVLLKVAINPAIESTDPRDELPQAKPHPSTDNWIKVLLSMPLPTRVRPNFSHHQPLP